MPMTEAEWLECDDPARMLDRLLGRTSARKLRLLACACCRTALRLMPDGRCAEGIDIAERLADESASDQEVDRAAAGIRAMAREMGDWSIQRSAGRPRGGWWTRDQGRERYLGYQSGNDALTAAALSLFARAVGFALTAGGEWRQSVEAARSALAQIEYAIDEQLCDLLRCLVGPLHFRPSPPLPPAVLAWNDGTVRRMAEGIYEVRRMPEGTLDAARLAILADALLDAGCEDEELMAHCRGDGPHVRGCWAVDAILARS
jgi:hypothetical protein